MPIIFGIISFPPIFATPLVMMGYISSVIISSSDNMCLFEELSTMTVDPSKPNPILSEDSTLEESMWHILSFEILQYKKVLLLVWNFAGLVIDF